MDFGPIGRSEPRSAPAPYLAEGFELTTLSSAARPCSQGVHPSHGRDRSPCRRWFDLKARIDMMQTSRLRDSVVLRTSVFVIAVLGAPLASAQLISQAPDVDSAETQRRMNEELEMEESTAPPDAGSRENRPDTGSPKGPDSHRTEPLALRPNGGVATEREGTCVAEVWPFEATRPELEEELRWAREAGDQRREAQLLVLLSNEAVSRGGIEEAAKRLDQALPLVMERANPWARAELLAQKAGLAHRLARLPQAEESLDQALMLARKLPPEIHECGEPVYVLLASRFMAGKFTWPDLATRRTAPLAFASITRLAYGRLLHELRRPEEAIHQLERVVEASSRIGPSLEAQAHYLLGAVEARRGHSEDAKKSFQLALAAMGGEECAKTSSAFPMTCFETLAAYADLMAAEGRSERALELSARAVEATRVHGDPVQELHVLSRRCSLLPRSEDYPSRVEIWEEGEKILGQLPEEADHVTASIYVSVMATCAGFKEKALAHVLRAEERLGDAITPEYEQLFSTMKLANSSMTGDWERAAPETRQGQSQTSAGPRALPTEQNFACWSAIHSERENTKLEKLKALIACLAESEPRFADIRQELEGFTPETPRDRWLSLMSRLLDSSPEPFKDSLQDFVGGYRQQETAGASSELAGVLRRMMVDCQQRGNPGFPTISRGYSEGLLKTPNQAMALLLAEERLVAGERCLRAARLDETFLRYAEQSRHEFEALVTLQARSGLFAEAFAVAERARAFSLMRWLGRPGPDLRSVASAALYEELQESKDWVRDLQARRTGADPRRADELQAAIEQQQKRQDDLLLRLKLTAPEYSELAAAHFVDLPTVQRSLPDDTALVSYYTMADQTLVWIVESATWRPVVLPMTRESLESQVHDMRRWLLVDRGSRTGGTSRGGVRIPGPEAVRWREASKDLHRVLIEPLALDDSIKRLLLVPHGTLQRLPFAALEDPESGTYLVERFSMSILPSASAATLWQRSDRLSPDRADGGRFLVFGDPRSDVVSLDSLPHARREALAIARRLGVRAMVDDEARESAVRAQAAELSLLVIAAHGVQNPEDPRRSFLALAPDASESSESNTHDGRLEMGEIFDEVRFAEQPLVVLSACETGLGRRAGGDEVEGFIRAFLFAGAGAVAATLWPIDDAASYELIESFFGSLRKGKSAAEALQQAQLQMLTEPRFAAPYFWAGFSLTGNPAAGL